MYIDNYNPYITAIPRKSLSQPMQVLYNKNLLRGNILDYGAGRGFDVHYLEELGFSIEGYDKYAPEFNDPSLLFNCYLTLTCNYMFNVIADWSEFQEALENIRRMGLRNFISVRADDKAIKDNWEYDPYADGYWTGRSFQRFYTIDRAREEFGDNIEIIEANKTFILFKLGDD